ncbi:hypothetical protein GCM10007924_32350 [Sneathiella chinensis]|uniref:Cobalamin biosynthesis protein CbiX n=1 Tax=Sneathiella chinensis TaxID=349750 RepID=A0ABQ5UA10_9PROT|nr:hypothetical protein GCM10007924_32350 [Sneathiella chinensis]
MIIVGHGSSTSKAAEVAAREHAETLRQSNRYGSVLVHFLTGGGPVPDLPAGEVFILPFFMSEGYFARRKIPEVFGLVSGERHEPERSLYQCDALGVDPFLAEILKQMAGEACRTLGIATGQAHVVLAAHGSKSSGASREAALFQQGELERIGDFRAVSSFFLEEAPGFEDLMRGRKEDQAPVIVLGLFSAAGPHASVDVPAALTAWEQMEKAAGNSTLAEVHYAGVVGVRPEVVRLIQESVTRRYAAPVRGAK